MDCAEFGLLQPEEIRRLRHDLGLTQRALEDILGVGEKTAARWKRGIYPQSRGRVRLFLFEQ